MILKLVRTEFTPSSTIGNLYADGKWICWVLEDKDRGLRDDMSVGEILGLKVKSQTCIPYGTYDVVMSMSNRFKRIMPEVLNVKGFQGIRIHSGNYSKDTEGCLIPGTTKSKDAVWQSRLACDMVYNLITQGLSKDKVSIIITK